MAAKSNSPCIHVVVSIHRVTPIQTTPKIRVRITGAPKEILLMLGNPHVFTEGLGGLQARQLLNSCRGVSDGNDTTTTVLADFHVLNPKPEAVWHCL